ncbi:MAG: RsmB/NOP family class I SAM-dependent RNA methyltransferase [Verrucomicrobia bacterium]|nr:RsmB/NOP family class I SAM-dependent RNA methyltransferase [Verrucomicrobiota bacterium]
MDRRAFTQPRHFRRSDNLDDYAARNRRRSSSEELLHHQAAAKAATVLEVAESVIRASDASRPADKVLRDTLRSHRGLEPDETAAVARAVFSYFRWLPWLDPAQPPAERIEAAVALADRFARDPQAWPADDLRRAVPDWVGEFMDLTPGWLRALQTEPVLWLRARRGTGAKLAERLEHCQPAGTGELADALLYSGREDLFRSPEFHAGDFELQDLHSQAVALICAPRPGETWWDACAGEGGKTLHLSALMENQGQLWASDRADWRLNNLKRRAARAGVFNYRMQVWDGSEELPTRTLFDGVLVDAPCSNLGTWHRNPHARWTCSANDIAELAQLQAVLLDHAAMAVKAGGKLIYSVCTLTRPETTEIAASFGAQHPDFVPLELSNPLDPAAPPASQIWLRQEDRPGNGMFIAAWRRQPVAEAELGGS